MTTTTSASTSSFDNTLSSLGIKQYGSTASTANTASSSSTGSTTLNQADFLKLLTAQLKDQDPFNPTDSNQMVSQMSELSEVSGIGDMNSTLTGIASKLGSTSTSDALSYVGKTVLTQGNTAYARTSGGIAGAVQLAGDATNVNVTISDANGNTLKTLSLGAQSAGTVNYDWDGTTGAGASAGGGPYTVSVDAANGGMAVTSHNLVWAPVESVSLPSASGGSPSLNVTGVGSVDPSAIVQVG